MSNKLPYELRLLCRRNRDGSHTTQYQRSRALRAMAVQLRELGYKSMRARSLKPKHVQALITHWRDQGLRAGTLKNRLAHIRWWAEKVGKRSVVPRDNIALGIDNRRYVTNLDKAVELDRRLDFIRDPRVRVSLELQQAFGLRREESLKFSPTYADKGDRVVLKASWAKGGRARAIPVRTPAQRAVLERAYRIAGTGSLIPPERSYIQHLKVYERHTADAGFSKLHGLRHAYAQARYRELTGWAPPVAGGPKSRDLTPAQRAADRGARLTVSGELGHGREEITRVYLGR